MKILDGVVPEGKIWRALVLFGPDQEPGLSWNFALQLAQASNGEAVGAAILPGATTENVIRDARAALKTAYERADDDDTVHTLLIEADNFREALVNLIENAGIDLLLADGDSPRWQHLERLPCAVAIIRGGAYRSFRDMHDGHHEDQPGDDEQDAPDQIKRILVPTAGGPNTAQALSTLHR